MSLHTHSESPASRSDDRNAGKGRIRNAAELVAAEPWFADLRAPGEAQSATASGQQGPAYSLGCQLIAYFFPRCRPSRAPESFAWTRAFTGVMRTADLMPEADAVLIRYPPFTTTICRVKVSREYENEVWNAFQ